MQMIQELTLHDGTTVLISNNHLLVCNKSETQTSETFTFAYKYYIGCKYSI